MLQRTGFWKKWSFAVLLTTLAFQGCGQNAGTSKSGVATNDASQSTSPTPVSSGTATRSPGTSSLLKTQLWETGGSNFVMFDVGSYAYGFQDDQSSPKKPDAPTIYPLIGTYHLDPPRVRKMMEAMYANGQRKIAFMVWHMPIHWENPSHVTFHFVDSKGAQLIPQHQGNLRAIMALVKEIGFNEIQFRFGPWGPANPGDPAETIEGGANGNGGWSRWNESQYQENWNFIVNTRKIVEESLAGSSVKRWYDLAAEEGGQTTGYKQEYVKRLWADYVYTYGMSDSFGASIAYAPGRMRTLVQTLAARGGKPPMYAVDVYENVYEGLKGVATELQEMGELHKPVLIQETYYNDPEARAAVERVMSEYGLKIHSIMQWPLARGGAPGVGVTMHVPLDYGQYFSSVNEIYSNGFESENSFGKGSGWSSWDNGATTAGRVERIHGDEINADGGRWALRLTSGTYSPNVPFAGFYLESPAVEITAESAVKLSLLARNAEGEGGFHLIFLDANGSEVEHSPTIEFNRGTWEFRNHQLTAQAPVAARKAKIRFIVKSGNTIIDLDRIRLIP